jgi:hypothetical protein
MEYLARFQEMWLLKSILSSGRMHQQAVTWHEIEWGGVFPEPP